MSFVGLALFAEGPTDHRFLSPILRRLTEETCCGLQRPIEIGDVMALTSPGGSHGRPRKERILEAAREACGAWTLLFIHTDGEGDPAIARAQRVTPAAERISSELSGGRCVAVVPVRETEAWAVADGNALRVAFGVTHDDASLGVPSHPRNVEGLRDPKAVLESAYQSAVRRRRRRRGGASRFLERIGEHVSFQVLASVPAFQQLRDDLAAALQQLGVGARQR